jgi:hypothetical protein
MGDKRAKVGASRIRRTMPGFGRVAVSWLFALALVFQVTLLQAHIHTPVQSGPTSTGDIKFAALDAAPAIGKTDASNPTGGRHAPSKTDTANCFYCQQLKLAGSMILPVSPAPVPVAQGPSHITAASIIALAPISVSHAWRSRAPPLSL